MFRRRPSAERISGGFEFLEGPVWLPQREELLFSDIPASRIYRLHAGKVEVFRSPSGQANGNTLDREGRLVTCEHQSRRVSRTESDGTVRALATHHGPKRLNSPNDVMVRKHDGSVYFTDPPYGVKAEERELDFQGVFRIAATSGSVAESGTQAPGLQLLVADFDKPNGLAFSPDETILYVADTERAHVRAFGVAEDGGLAGSRVFCRVERPDGMRVDAAGSLWIAAKTGVKGFDALGAEVATIAVAEQPANLAFGDADRQTLYITARKGLYRIRVAVPGLA
jgi:sugar lactone lactonase YvrE